MRNYRFSNYNEFCDDGADEAELRAQVLADKRYRNRLLSNPDCRDPEHAGCSQCMETEEVDDEQN